MPSLTILCHPDPARIGQIAVLTELISPGNSHLSRNYPYFTSPDGGAARPLEDPHLSRTPIEITRLSQNEFAVDASNSRTSLKINRQPVDRQRRLPVNQLNHGVTLLLATRVLLLLRQTEQRPAPSSRAARSFYPELVGCSTGIATIKTQIQQVADLEDFPVLLRGETGTGKELVARAIHDSSQRAVKTYLAVNMAAIPRDLASAELFGVVKGAFTGADRTRNGLFQRADGGTLFLDEIGDTPSEVQVALLRALEKGQIQKVGGDSPQGVDVRLVAATDVDLDLATAKGTFREALFHRLGTFTIFLPPLRHRLEDFGLLFFHFLRQDLRAMNQEERLNPSEKHPWVPADLVDRLMAYSWPGNIRQLRNVVRQLAVGSRTSDEMKWQKDLERLFYQPSKSDLTTELEEHHTRTSRADNRSYPRKEFTQDEILRALEGEAYNVSQTAERLRIPRSTLNKMIATDRRIRKPSDLQQQEIESAIKASNGDLQEAAKILKVSHRGLVLQIGRLGL